MNIWYLAHPVAGDDRFTFEQNMEHTVKVMGILFNAGFNVIAPWHTLCLAVPDDNAANRARGLDIDCEVVRMVGRLILTGHRLSSGMRKELAALEEFGLRSDFIIDLTGVRDCDLAEAACAALTVARMGRL